MGSLVIRYEFGHFPRLVRVAEERFQNAVEGAE